MSITKETLEQHLKDPAIFCCRREKGTVIGAADLEDRPCSMIWLKRVCLRSAMTA